MAFFPIPVPLFFFFIFHCFVHPGHCWIEVIVVHILVFATLTEIHPKDHSWGWESDYFFLQAFMDFFLFRLRKVSPKSFFLPWNNVEVFIGMATWFFSLYLVMYISWIYFLMLNSSCIPRRNPIWWWQILLSTLLNFILLMVNLIFLINEIYPQFVPFYFQSFTNFKKWLRWLSSIPLCTYE